MRNRHHEQRLLQVHLHRQIQSGRQKERTRHRQQGELHVIQVDSKEVFLSSRTSTTVQKGYGIHARSTVLRTGKVIGTEVLV